MQNFYVLLCCRNVFRLVVVIVKLLIKFKFSFHNPSLFINCNCLFCFYLAYYQLISINLSLISLLNSLLISNIAFTSFLFNSDFSISNIEKINKKTRKKNSFKSILDLQLAQISIYISLSSSSSFQFKCTVPYNSEVLKLKLRWLIADTERMKSAYLRDRVAQ